MALAGRVNPWTAQICFWNDESFSWAVARAPLPEVPAMVAEDTHPPGHYVLLHLWIRIFGDSIFSMRLLSGLFSTAAVLLAYLAARHGFAFKQGEGSRELAFVAGLLCALNPACASTAYMARMYAMLMFGTMLSVLGCVLIFRTPERLAAWVTWAIGALISVYSHNYGLFVVAGELTWLAGAVVVNARMRTGRVVRMFALSAGAVVLCYLPWVPFLLGQARRVSGGFWIPPLKWEAVAGFGAQLFTEPISVLTSPPLNRPLIALATILIGLFVVIPWFGAAIEWLFLMLLLTHAAAIIVTTKILHQSIFEVRYLLHLVPLAMINLASRPFVIYGRPLRRCVHAIFVFVVGIAGISALATRTPAGEAILEAAEWLIGRVQPEDLVIGDGQCYFRLKYYLEHFGVNVPLTAYAPYVAQRNERLVVYAPALVRAGALTSLDGLRHRRIWTVASLRSALAMVTLPGYRRKQTRVLYDVGCADEHSVVVSLWVRESAPGSVASLR